MRSHRGAAARIRLRIGIGALWLMRIGAFALLFVPIALVIAMSFGGDAYATFPPRSWSFKWYVNVFRRDEFVSSFVTSLIVAAFVTPISVTVGTLAAYGLWRRPGRGARAFESLFMSPILLPLVVTGLAVLVFVSRVGIGAGIPAIVGAHVAITFPYAFRAVLAALGRYDRRLDEAAASLKVRPFRSFWHVTLPLIRPGIVAGAMFAFVMSFDDFAATIFLIAPDTRTLPIAIYQYMEFNLDPTVSAVSSLLVVAATAAVLVVERLIGVDRFFGIGDATR
jgi:putative spermidine/putrescine transport system permease protein